MFRFAQAAIEEGWNVPAPAAQRWDDLSVSDFPSFDYSMKDVKRAGEVIAGSHPLSPEILEAFKVANNWREGHAYPMRSIRYQLIWYMKLLDIAGLTGARLKRMQAIRRKLQRLGLHLNQLQDLGGCRAIVPQISDVRALAAALREKSRHELRGGGNDYVSSPKRDGYRSHHLIFTYQGRGDAIGFSGRRIEVQIVLNYSTHGRPP